MGNSKFKKFTRSFLRNIKNPKRVFVRTIEKKIQESQESLKTVRCNLKEESVAF